MQSVYQSQTEKYYDSILLKRENSNSGKIMSAKVCQRFLYSLPTLEQFFLKVGQNNIGKKILFMPLSQLFSVCFHAVNYIQFTFRSHYLNDLTWRQIPNSSN